MNLQVCDLVLSHNETTGDTAWKPMVWQAGETQTVQAITHDARHHDTYNFEVADYHTYFVGNDSVWVHNTCSIFAKNLNIVGSTQPELYQGTLDYMSSAMTGLNAANFWAKALQTDEPIKIWEINGSRYLYNGHHRYFASIQAGVPIPSNQIEILVKNQASILTFDLKNMDIIK